MHDIGHVRRRISPVWKAAQAVSVIVAVTVVALLVVNPEWGLFITWFVLIPLVPALLLVAPMVWRNLCPIAVVHQLPRLSGRGGKRRLSERTQRRATAVAAAGLLLIVPLRLPLFNQNGPALAAFVLAVLAFALVGGLLFAGKAGWCATWCPVGPVERLYGQQPLLSPTHAHCAECIGCSDPCFDRDGPPAVSRMLGEPFGVDRTDSDGNKWLWQSPMGVFGSAFPGFIMGYFTVEAGSGVGGIYLHVALLAAASLVTLVILQALFGLTARATVRIGAAAAAVFYYWFTVPLVLDAASSMWQFDPVPDSATWTLRAVFLLLIFAWFVDAPRRVRAFAASRQAPSHQAV